MLKIYKLACFRPVMTLFLLRQSICNDGVQDLGHLRLMPKRFNYLLISDIALQSRQHVISKYASFKEQADLNASMLTRIRQRDTVDHINPPTLQILLQQPGKSYSPVMLTDDSKHSYCVSWMTQKQRAEGMIVYSNHHASMR